MQLKRKQVYMSRQRRSVELCLFKNRSNLNSNLGTSSQNLEFKCSFLAEKVSCKASKLP